MAFSAFTHLQIIKNHFIKILPLFFNPYGFLVVQLEPSHYGFVFFVLQKINLSENSGQNANAHLKIHSIIFKDHFKMNYSFGCGKSNKVPFLIYNVPLPLGPFRKTKSIL